MTTEWCRNEFGTLALSVYYPRPSVPVPRKEGRMIINKVRMLLEWFWHIRPLYITMCHMTCVTYINVGIVFKKYPNDRFPMRDGFQLVLIYCPVICRSCTFVVVTLWSCGVHCTAHEWPLYLVPLRRASPLLGVDLPSSSSVHLVSLGHHWTASTEDPITWEWYRRVQYWMKFWVLYWAQFHCRCPLMSEIRMICLISLFH